MDMCCVLLKHWLPFIASGSTQLSGIVRVVDHSLSALREWPVEVKNVSRQFKFGGDTLVSSYEIKFNAMVYGEALDITASVVSSVDAVLVGTPSVGRVGSDA